MADTSPSFSTRHSVLSSSGKDDLYSILGGSNGAENRPLATYPVKQFSRKKEAREWPLRPLWGCSRIHLDTRPLRETSPVFLLFFFHAQRKHYDILFRLFPTICEGMRSSLEEKTSCDPLSRFARICFYEIVGKELILQLFEKSCVGVS